MRKSLYKLLFICVVVLSSCSNDLKQTISPTTSEQKSNQQQIKKSEQKQQNYETIASLPPQFYAATSLNSLPGRNVIVDINSRITANAEVFVYRIQTPLLFLNEIEDLKAPKISKNILLALGKALPNTEPNIFEDLHDYIPIGTFTFIYKKQIKFTGTTGKWKKQKISLTPLPDGFYLLETRIGPQASYLPVVISSLNLFTKVGKNTVAWVADSITGEVYKNFPIFYEDQEGNWQKQMTNAKGIVTISNNKPSWLIAWSKSQLQIAPLVYHSRSDRNNPTLWIDRNVYQAGESLYCAWQSQQKASEIKLLSPQGKVILTEKSLPQAHKQLVLPEDLEPGNYLLQLKRNQNSSHKAFKIVKEEKIAVGNKHIYLPRNIYLTGETIRATIFSTLPQQVEISLYLQDGTSQKLIDRQKRFIGEKKSVFFFQSTEPGIYTLSTNTQSLSLEIHSPDELEKISLNKSTYDKEEQIKVLVPANPFPQLLLWKQQDNFYSRLITSLEAKWINLKLLPDSRSISINLITSRERQAVGYDINLNSHSQWQIQMPDSIFVKEPVTIKLNNSDNTPYNCLMWAISGDNRKKPVFHKSNFNIVCSSTSFTIKNLHDNWIRQELLKDYAKALAAYSNKNYTEVIDIYQRMSKMAPKHPVTELVSKSVAKVYHSKNKQVKSTDPIERLKKTIIPYIPPGEKLEQFLDIISTKSGVYIELDPQVQGVLINKIPASQDALSLINYVLGINNLVYKKEYGALFIAQNTKDIKQQLFKQLDKTIGKQMQLLQRSQKTIDFSDNFLRQTAFWNGWQKVDHLFQSQIQFPSPGLWTIHLLIIDKQNQTHKILKTIWVTERN